MRLPPYPRHKPSGIEWLGDVPEHWSLTRLRDATKLVNGFPFDSDLFSQSDGVPLVRIRDIYSQSTEVLWSGPPIREAEISDGDILIGMDGDFNVAWWAGGRALLNQRVCCLRSKPSVVSQRFLFYALPFPLKSLNDITYSTTVKHLSSLDVLRFRFYLPAPQEQRAIADFLDRETVKIDTLVAKKRTLIERLKEKRTALISRTVTRGLPPDAARATGLDPHPKLKPSGIDWLGDAPAHWKIGKFSREVRIAEGQADPEIEPYASMILVAPNHIESGTGRLLAKETAADQGAISGKYLCRAGEVIYSKIRPALAKAVLAPEDCLCSADMYPMSSTGRLRSRYLLLTLLSLQFTAWSVLEADRVAMPKVNRETLNDLRLPVPPGKEQDEIADFLERETARIDGMVSKVETAIERLQEYRTALITATVTGKIDVRGAVA